MAARLIVLALLLAWSVAAAETRPGYGGAIVGSVLGEPASLDPIAAQTPADVAVVGLLYDTLYRIGPDGVVAPHLAAALPDVTGTAARITLRLGIQFQDGTTLTASQVAATLMQVKASAAGWLLAGVTTILVEGDDVVLRLTTPRTDLAAILAAPQTAIRSGSSYVNRSTGRHSLRGGLGGSGPFRLVPTKKDYLELEANDDHFAGRPYLDRVTLRWFTSTIAEARLYETGGSQWSLRGATSFAGRKPPFATDELESPATVLVYLGFGGGHPLVTGNRDFRAAVDAALNRRGLDHVGAGERALPTQDPVPEELGGPALADEASDAHLDVAQAALGRAGVTVRELRADRIAALGLEIVFEQTRPDDREIAERVARALDRLGIRSTIAAVSATELATHRIATTDLYIGQLAAAVPSPGFWFAQAYAIGGDRDVADRLAAAATVDIAKTRTEFARRLPIVPLLHRAIHVHHRGALRGAWFDASARLGIADLFLWGAP